MPSKIDLSRLIFELEKQGTYKLATEAMFCAFYSGRIGSVPLRLLSMRRWSQV